MKEKNKINLVIYLFVAFVLGGLVMYYIAINTNVYQENKSGNTTNNSCRACSGTVIVNDGSLSASVEKIYDAVMALKKKGNYDIQIYVLDTLCQSGGVGLLLAMLYDRIQKENIDIHNAIDFVEKIKLNIVKFLSISSVCSMISVIIFNNKNQYHYKSSENCFCINKMFHSV